MLKLGFIGCGGIATYHAKVIRSSVKGIEIVAGADVDPKALRAWSAASGATRLYDDHRTMLKEAPIDAVCVAVPTFLHARMAVAAARAGKHVFSEKPMARTLKGCDAIAEACERSGVTLLVGQVRRYDEDWGTWGRLVREGAVGRPVLWRQHAGGGPPKPWFMDAEMGAGPFMDGCVHNWDYANLVFGRPVEAVAQLRRLGPGTAFDTGSATVRYAKGDEVTLCWSWGLPSGSSARHVSDILGPRGILQFPGTYGEEALPKGFDSKRFGAYLVQNGSRKRVVKFPKRDMFAAEWKDFAHAARTGEKPVAGPANARAAVAVALAVLEAAAKGRAVPVRM
jgi:UDP-N-acetylglucosamine 3-dehydrogenase